MVGIRRTNNEVGVAIVCAVFVNVMDKSAVGQRSAKGFFRYGYMLRFMVGSEASITESDCARVWRLATDRQGMAMVQTSPVMLIAQSAGDRGR